MTENRGTPPLLFDVPFVADAAYADFLKARLDRFHSLHFSLYDPEIPDARHRYAAIGADRLIDGLRPLRGPKKYALLNSRFFFPEGYFDADRLRGIMRTLGRLRAAGVLDGVVYADLYLLWALSDADPDIASELEAAPGINCMIDDADKAAVLLEAAGRTWFRPPSKLILDRSLNRRIPDLAALSARLRKTRPDMKIALMANEGCLYHCPFKLTHDAHIALAYVDVPLDTHVLNQTRGCMRFLGETPHHVFKSPFIRPEDGHHYAGLANVLKICGRTLGGKFLTRTVAAYLDGGYDGNLLDLMDALDWMAERFCVDNAALPKDFFLLMTGCSKSCDGCGVCREMWDACARSLPVRFRDLRGA